MTDTFDRRWRRRLAPLALLLLLAACSPAGTEAPQAEAATWNESAWNEAVWR